MTGGAVTSDFPFVDTETVKTKPFKLNVCKSIGPDGIQGTEGISRWQMLWQDLSELYTKDFVIWEGPH